MAFGCRGLGLRGLGVCTSFEYLQEPKVTCPNVQLMALDPVHLAMTLEYASGRRKAALSKALRQILRKLTAYSSGLHPTTWGATYTGQTCASLSREEERLRAQIEDRSMRQRDAQAVLDNLQPASGSDPSISSSDFGVSRRRRSCSSRPQPQSFLVASLSRSGSATKSITGFVRRRRSTRQPFA